MRNEKEIAGIIAEQIGNKAFVMMGAKNLAFGVNKNNDVYLGFRIGRNSKGINYIKITLNGKDLYDIEFGSIRKYQYKVKESFNDVFVDSLHGIIEKSTGMYLSLERSYS